VNFDLNLKRFNTDDCTRIDLGRHIRTLSSFVIHILQELFFLSNAHRSAKRSRTYKLAEPAT
jgi:hypothetical protein